jgi:hypothetical protein
MIGPRNVSPPWWTFYVAYFQNGAYAKQVRRKPKNERSRSKRTIWFEELVRHGRRSPRAFREKSV